MENSNKAFGKFQKSKIEGLSTIKGGVLVADTKTTLCITNEATFDTDSVADREDLKNAHCEAPDYA